VYGYVYECECTLTTRAVGSRSTLADMGKSVTVDERTTAAELVRQVWPRFALPGAVADYVVILVDPRSGPGCRARVRVDGCVVGLNWRRAVTLCRDRAHAGGRRRGLQRTAAAR
jgi:hypothetical protein